MTSTEARVELPPMPARIAGLPVDHRGYPVPWFAAWADENGTVTARGTGVADHRILYPRAMLDALEGHLCWICGGRLGAHIAFVIGPMCVVNRTTAEPGSHLECARWAAVACPFLTRPHARRREQGGLVEVASHPAGVMLKRNPGATCVWVTKAFRLWRVPSGNPDGVPGILLRLGHPTKTEWYAQGREATRQEVIDSIEGGLPTLREYAEQDGPGAQRALARQVETATAFLPA